MIKKITNIINNFYKKRNQKKIEKIYKKKLEELRKRDPFVYRHQ